MPQRHGTIVFIDENLQDNKIGALSVPWPPAPQQIIARIREQYSHYDEMKWSTITRQKVPFLTSDDEPDNQGCVFASSGFNP